MSEWSVFVAQECDLAFEAGADLATVITAATAAETYLRAEYGSASKQQPFFELINQSPLPSDLKKDLHDLRRFRNQWVHIATPEDDQEIIDNPETYRTELEKRAIHAQRTLRRTLYENQLV
ncbi:MAG: hypothetical protein ABJL55_12195 [Roseibium sp.]